MSSVAWTIDIPHILGEHLRMFESQFRANSNVVLKHWPTYITSATDNNYINGTQSGYFIAVKCIDANAIHQISRRSWVTGRNSRCMTSSGSFPHGKFYKTCRFLRITAKSSRICSFNAGFTGTFFISPLLRLRSPPNTVKQAYRVDWLIVVSHKYQTVIGQSFHAKD